MISDEELLYELQKGHESALEALVHRYHRQIFAYLYRVTHNYHLAEDLAQETFWRMCKTVKLYKYPRSFKPWLYTIASNITRDHWRSAGNKPTQELPEELAAEGNVEEWFERQENRQRVVKALGQLEGSRREIVILRFYQDLTLAEISQVTGFPLGTVKSRLHYALKELRELLKGGGNCEIQVGK